MQLHENWKKERRTNKIKPIRILSNYKKLDLPNNGPVEIKGGGLFDDFKKASKKAVKKKVRQGVEVLKIMLRKLPEQLWERRLLVQLLPQDFPLLLPLQVRRGIQLEGIHLRPQSIKQKTNYENKQEE